MNAVTGTILVVLLGVVGFAPRRWALLAMMAGVFFLTQGQSVEIAGLNLYPIRILATAAFGRVLVRRELVSSQLNRIDVTLVLLYNYAALVWILRSSDVTAQQFASAIEPTLCYLAFRGLIGGLDDLRWLLKAFAVLLLPFTALIYSERQTGQNAFLIVGGYAQMYFRDGVTRCMGPFRHAILMGSVAASFLPLYIALALAEKRQGAAYLGAVLCLGLVALSNSGGPVISTAAVFLGWSLWPLRKRMFVIRWAVVAVLLVLTAFMNAPLWYLPYKISSVVGGSGYHRSLLMENAWNDLGKWWLVGMDVRDTAPWIPYTLEAVGGGVDVTNQFLVFGIRGGLLALGLLVGVLSLGFIGLGAALISTGDVRHAEKGNQFLLWGLGVTLFVHAVSWLGISFFDQSWVVWLMHLAAVSAAVQAMQGHVAETSTLAPPIPLRVPSHPVGAWVRRIGASRSRQQPTSRIRARKSIAPRQVKKVCR